MTHEDIVKAKTCCFTGHRPDKLYGYDMNSEGNLKLRKSIRNAIVHHIENFGVDTFISGMALGVDMWAALEVIRLREKYPHIKLVAAIPCIRQWSKWNPKDTLLWRQITQKCDFVHMVTNAPYTPSCMQIRNIWMVDHSKYIIAVYDGSESGGTFNCLKYARKQYVHIYILDPREV